MNVRFWGVRGSVPAPLTPDQLRAKILSVLEKLSPEDLKNSDTRQNFLSSLHPSLFGTVGGNTPCLEVRSKGAAPIIFDAGSGIRELGLSAVKEEKKPSAYHIFFSHLHWDHIQGLPFFAPAYDPSVSVDFYSPHETMKDALSDQMSHPCFPVSMDVMGAKKSFHLLKENVTLGPLTVSYKKMNHPGVSYSYLVTDGKKRFIYATDIELGTDDFLRNDENAVFFGGADLLVIDSQYTLGEAIEKYSWGHTAFSLAVDFASNWGIPKVVLFHHDPAYDDDKLYGMLDAARGYTRHMAIQGVEVLLAVEGTSLTV